jgi:hypothetical protein
MEILSYILADTVSRPPRAYNGYVQWNQKPSYLLCFTEKYLYFNTVINSLIIIKTLTCKIPPNLPLPKGGITPRWQRGATCLHEVASAKAGGRFLYFPLR